MTSPRPSRTSARALDDGADLAVPIGPRLVELLELAYRARRPVLLEGPTGIGKSQIVETFARSSGLDFVVLDLSLLEPPDLVGLPVLEGGRTRYASPAELPTHGRGVLMLEELNRAEIPVMQPALQLLSARRLHAYELPPGWFAVAAINPDDGEHQVSRLDPALRARFLQVRVCADRGAWLLWATRANVHPLVAQVVREHADAFDHAPPRSWAYASEILAALRPEEHADHDLVRLALRGFLPSAWAWLLTDALTKSHAPVALDVDAALTASSGERVLASAVRELEAQRRGDAIAALATRLRHALAHTDLGPRIAAGELTLAALERTFAALPGDLRDQCLVSAVESPAAPALLAQLGHTPEAIASAYVGSTLQNDVLAARRDMKPHRVRLPVVVAIRWLRAAPPDAAARTLAQLEALARDAGPLGEDLARHVRAFRPDEGR